MRLQLSLPFFSQSINQKWDGKFAGLAAVLLVHVHHQDVGVVAR